MISIYESKQEVDQIENKIHHLFCLIFEPAVIAFDLVAQGED
jgi:hypothetical protein